MLGHRLAVNPRGFGALVVVQPATLHLRHCGIGMRSCEAEQDQHACVGRMIGLPLMLVSDLPANFLGLFPGAARFIPVRF